MTHVWSDFQKKKKWGWGSYWEDKGWEHPPKIWHAKQKNKKVHTCTYYSETTQKNKRPREEFESSHRKKSCYLQRAQGDVQLTSQDQPWKPEDSGVRSSVHREKITVIKQNNTLEGCGQNRGMLRPTEKDLRVCYQWDCTMGNSEGHTSDRRRVSPNRRSEIWGKLKKHNNKAKWSDYMDKPNQTLMLRKTTTSCGDKRKKRYLTRMNITACVCVYGVNLKHVKIPWGPCIAQKGAKVRTTVTLS